MNHGKDYLGDVEPIGYISGVKVTRKGVKPNPIYELDLVGWEASLTRENVVEKHKFLMGYLGTLIDEAGDYGGVVFSFEPPPGRVGIDIKCEPLCGENSSGGGGVRLTSCVRYNDFMRYDLPEPMTTSCVLELAEV